MVMSMALKVKSVKISKGFQITVPAEIREKYGLKDGDELILVDLGTEVVIRPVRKKAKLTGLIGKFETESSFDSVKEHDELGTEVH